ncbi:entericidin A/B family lipoprotein [Dryocola sp. LX212]|jgi:entericidin A
MNSKLKCFLFIAFLASFLSGCNTTRGFGEDLQHLGGSIERAANK